MLTADSIRRSLISEDTAARIADLWNASYPHMRELLSDVITANRTAQRPLVNVRDAERVRLELGQVDRGTHRPCTQSPPGFSAYAAYSLVRHALDLVSTDTPHAGDFYRLAAELSDAVQALTEARRSAA